MKTHLLSIEGKKIKEIGLPNCFSHPIREDIVQKVLESKKTKQPYAPNLMAGKQASAKGQLVHRRKVWKSQYGRGMARTPRKRLSRRGTQFNWVGAFSPNTPGGFRAHPPKIQGMIKRKRMNKKELKLALYSAISATTKKEQLVKKYKSVNEKQIIDLPLVVEGKITSLKTKGLILSLKNILGKELFNLAIKKKSIRPGKGKLRGRKYKRNAGLLLVLGANEKLKTPIIDTANSNKLNVVDLAKGGQGRLTIYTEEAIKQLGELK